MTTKKSYLTVNDVANGFGVSRSTIWRWTKEGILQKPEHLTKRTVRWTAQDVEELRVGVTVEKPKSTASNL